ncbi:hypothetical protein BD779DRAFT_1470518 [Infundibulicybe gibba]|nr:hypothetical protein BD779DRAFT_1470518 [Infundibulicybe gibba]
MSEANFARIIPPELDTSDERLSRRTIPKATMAPTCRFRSRVRITSGIHRPRNHTKFPTSPEIQNAFDPFAPQHGSIRSVRSRASSPSSSISVPLRTPRTTIQLACQRNSSRGRRRNARKRRRDTQSAGDAADGVNERTPLVQTVDDSRYYVESEGIQPHDHSVESDRDHEQDQLSREIDRYFGRWPVRLLNPHWWWWQLEPIVCCRFEEDDVEY